jgi:hypothetical protein
MHIGFAARRLRRAASSVDSFLFNKRSLREALTMVRGACPSWMHFS